VFGDEDPLKADGREMLDGATARCRQLREDMKFYVDFGLPGSAIDEVELARKLIQRAAIA
jgi:hypothetical protein